MKSYINSEKVEMVNRFLDDETLKGMANADKIAYFEKNKQNILLREMGLKLGVKTK